MTTKPHNLVSAYVARAIRSFIDDPPYNKFQIGYLAALLDVWTGALGNKDTKEIAKVRSLLEPVHISTEQ